MKKMMLILVMLLIAATSYNQTSRKPANTKETATKPQGRTTQVSPQRSTTPSNQERSTVTRRTEQPSTSPRDNRDNKQPATTSTRPDSRTVNSGRTVAPGRTENAPVNNRSNAPVTTTNRSTRRTTAVVADPATRNYHTQRPNERPNHRVVEYSSPRTYHSRHAVSHHYQTPPRSVEYRRQHYVYRRPVNYEIYWTPALHRHFIEIYPMVPSWGYHNGYRIEMISAYDAMYYRGDVMTVYGRVTDVYYARNTDEYFLYFGPYYPYQDFTVVIPGYLARRYSRNPERYFTDRHMAVTGLITTYEGEPEIVVKKDFQLNLY